MSGCSQSPPSPLVLRETTPPSRHNRRCALRCALISSSSQQLWVWRTWFCRSMHRGLPARRSTPACCPPHVPTAQPPPTSLPPPTPLLPALQYLSFHLSPSRAIGGSTRQTLLVTPPRSSGAHVSVRLCCLINAPAFPTALFTSCLSATAPTSPQVRAPPSDQNHQSCWVLVSLPPLATSSVWLPSAST